MHGERKRERERGRARAREREREREGQKERKKDLNPKRMGQIFTVQAAQSGKPKSHKPHKIVNLLSVTDKNNDSTFWGGG